MNIPDIIIGQVESEKTTLLQEQWVYTFKISKKATTVDVKTFFESVYDMKVKSVNRVKVRPKAHSRRKTLLRRKSYDKCYVTFEDNASLDLLSFKISKNK